MKRLCEHSQHHIVMDPDSWTWRCSGCPLVFPRSAVQVARQSESAFVAMVRNAERDWYIKELES